MLLEASIILIVLLLIWNRDKKISEIIRSMEDFLISQEVKTKKSFEKCTKILQNLQTLHMGNDIKHYIQPDGHKEFKKIIEKVIVEYDNETEGEIMASEIKDKFLKKSEEQQKKIEKIHQEMQEVKATKSFEKCTRILHKLKTLHMRNDIKHYIQPDGHKEFKTTIEKIIVEYDKETEGEIMANEIKNKFREEKKLEESFLIDVEKALKKIDEDQKKIEKIHQEMQEFLDKLRDYFKNLDGKIDEQEKKILMKYYEKKMKCLKEGNFDEANKVDKEIQLIQQTIENKGKSLKNNYKLEIQQEKDQEGKVVRIKARLVNTEKSRENAVDSESDTKDYVEDSTDMASNVADELEDNEPFFEIPANLDDFTDIVDISNSAMHLLADIAGIVDKNSTSYKITSKVTNAVAKGSKAVDSVTDVVDAVDNGKNLLEHASNIVHGADHVIKFTDAADMSKTAFEFISNVVDIVSNFI